MANPLVEKYYLLTRGGILCLLSFLALDSKVNAQEIACKVNRELKSDNYGQITIEGLGEELGLFRSKVLSTEDWTQFFSVKVEGATRMMLGSYEVSEAGLTFTPRFLPDPQVSYEVSFSSNRVLKFLKDFSLETDSTWIIKFDGIYENPAEVVSFFPQCEMLPANILRIYLTFSEPMSFENPHDFIRIENEEGQIVTEPFVEIEEGLWNENRTRLTLLFHPGRIKRGVGPNMTQGEIFQIGEKYILKVSKNWNAGSGNELKQSYSRSFQIMDPIRKTINIEDWKLDSPDAGSDKELVIRTNHLLDKALAERMISVFDSSGSLVNGAFVFEGSRMELIFRNSDTWRAGAYQIRINPKLEDVCGNTPINVFDLEGSGQIQAEESMNLIFVVK